MSKKALFLLATRWLSWVSLFFLLLLGHWKMEQNKEVDGVAGVNAGVALLWSGFLQAKDHWDSTFISHSYKQNKQECPASLCSWANSWDKEPKPNSTVSAGYKVRVRAAAWGVWKGDFALCSPFLLGFLGLTVSWGSGGCFCSCKCCLRHKVLARDWKYFEFWFSKLALNLVTLKISFTCWVRNLFKLQYFSLSNYWRGSKLIFSFIFTVQKMSSIYKDSFGLMFWRTLKVNIMLKKLKYWQKLYYISETIYVLFYITLLLTNWQHGMKFWSPFS